MTLLTFLSLKFLQLLYYPFLVLGTRVRPSDYLEKFLCQCRCSLCGQSLINLVHHRFQKLHRNIVVAAGTIVSKAQNNLLEFIVGGIVDSKCVGIWDPVQQL